MLPTPGRAAALLAALIAPVLALAPPATAQDTRVIGTVEASFAGETLRQELTAVTTGSETMATAEFDTSGGVSMVMIYTAAAPQLSLSLGWMGAASAGAAPFEAGVSLFPSGLLPHWTDEETREETRFTLTRLDLTGPEPAISGTFEARLCLRESLAAGVDTTRCEPVSGSFDTALFPAP